MKDFLGRDLVEGDSVVIITPSYRSFTLARVTGFTATKVKVEYASTGEYKYQLRQLGSQLCKVDGPDLTMYLLTKVAE
jgi:hypothetical protein